MTDTTVVDKSENPTDSATYSFKESYDAVGGVVTQLLGNNGSINITKDNTKSIEVEKFWNVDANAEHPKYVEVKLIAKGTKVSADGTSEEFVKLMDTQTLSDSNNWKYTWTRQPVTTTSNGITYNYAVYYVAETVPEGYAASYSNKDGNAILTERVTNKEETTDSDKTGDETTSDDSKVSPYSVGISIFPIANPEVDADAADATSGYVLITNTTSYKLPESGGIGDKVFTMGATASVLAVLLMIIINKRKKTVE
jgi:ribosomal protein S8E